jgi:hypothetical protein
MQRGSHEHGHSAGTGRGVVVTCSQLAGKRRVAGEGQEGWTTSRHNVVQQLIVIKNLMNLETKPNGSCTAPIYIKPLICTWTLDYKSMSIQLMVLSCNIF